MIALEILKVGKCLAFMSGVVPRPLQLKERPMILNLVVEKDLQPQVQNVLKKKYCSSVGNKMNTRNLLRPRQIVLVKNTVKDRGREHDRELGQDLESPHRIEAEETELVVHLLQREVIHYQVI